MARRNAVGAALLRMYGVNCAEGWWGFARLSSGKRKQKTQDKKPSKKRLCEKINTLHFD